MPTLSALKYHMLRSEFVLKTVFDFTNSAPIDPSQYGWRMDGESGISIVWDDEETIKAVVARDVVARVLNAMGQLQSVGIVTECASLVILCVSAKVVVIIPITTVERVQDVNHRMKVTTMPLMMNKRLLNHYHFYPVMQIP